MMFDVIVINPEITIHSWIYLDGKQKTENKLNLYSLNECIVDARGAGGHDKIL